MNLQPKKVIALFNKYKVWLGLFVFIVVAYLPLSSFQFALKNDAFIYNFPNKYFFSEALKSGFIPWWNPYLNYGFPLYADPGFAWWNPITWIFGLIGYNPYTFTVELLLYLFIAATGMYWLARKLSINTRLAFTLGCMFAGSGFFVGNMQHINFLSCAAFIPWVVGTWITLQKSPSYKYAFFTAIASYLLCSAGHPAIPIGMIYFMVFLSVLYYFFFQNELRFQSFLGWNLVYCLMTFLLLLPLIMSWAQLMPLYARNQSVDHLSTTKLGFTIPSYISFLSPAAIIKDDSFYNTDVSMRNAYFSQFGFVAFIVSIIYPKTKVQKIFLISGVLMLLVSMGGLVKQALYENLPLLSFIRTNGEFRVFCLLCFILVTGLFLQSLHLKQIPYSKLKFPFQVTVAAIGLITLSFSIPFVFNKDSLLQESIFTSEIKTTLDHLTLPKALLAGFFLSLIFCSLYLFILKKSQAHMLYIFIVVDLIVNIWILLPVTGVGQRSVAYVSSLIDKAPKGFPKPSLVFEAIDVPINIEDQLRIGNWSWYDKQIVHKRIDYPSALLATERFYTNIDTSYFKKPFAFLKQGHGKVSIEKFGPNGFSFLTSLTSNDTLVILQNIYPGWKLFLPGKPNQLIGKSTFIQTPLSKSDTFVRLKFCPL